jgi:hypothetical protein
LSWKERTWKFTQFLAHFPYFEKIKVGLWDHHAVSVNPPCSLLTFECLSQSNTCYIGTSAHLNGVLHYSLSLVCVSVRVSPYRC